LKHMGADEDEEPVSKTVHWASILRQHRLSQNMKQSALAYDLGVTQAMVSRWESGKAEPAAAMQKRIEEMLDQADMGSPMVAWREIASQQPAMVGLINEKGFSELVSAGTLRELGLNKTSFKERSIYESFEGDFISLFEGLKAAGFFEGKVDMAESADYLQYTKPDGSKVSFFGHGLHWPHMEEDGKIRWVTSGARISEQEFKSMREELGGQMRIMLAE